MTYQEFNKKILEYYLSRSSSEYCTLSIDRHELETVIPVEELSGFMNLRSNWQPLTRRIDDIPQYLGLLAIQCYAAYEMQKDKEKTANAYKIRLCKILMLEESQLQNLFKGEDGDYPIQEEIWCNVRQYFKEDFELKINIPERTMGAGRFVQFPKSQALLNTEDLKCFSFFFAEEFQINENIPFTYFKKKLNRWLSNTSKEKISKRSKDLLEDEDKKERCTEQVYNYFNRWDGSVYNTKFDKIKISTTHANLDLKTEQQKILLIFDNSTPTFYFKGKSINDISVLNQPNYKYIYKNILLFNECDYYPNEYEDSRFLYKNTISYILIDPQSYPLENRYLLQHNLSFIKMNNSCMLYKFAINEDHIFPTFKKYIQDTTPIKLRGGIKIGNTNLYLQGYGPSIVGTVDSVIYNNQRCIYNSEKAETGLYKVRAGNYKDLEFTVVDSSERIDFIHSKLKGWNFKQISVAIDFDIEGGLLKLKSEEEAIPTIRTWINVNLKKDKTKFENNILMRAIKNSKA